MQILSTVFYIMQYSYRICGSAFHFHAYAFKGGEKLTAKKKIKRRPPAVEAFSAHEKIVWEGIR